MCAHMHVCVYVCICMHIYPVLSTNRRGTEFPLTDMYSVKFKPYMCQKKACECMCVCVWQQVRAINVRTR